MSEDWTDTTDHDPGIALLELFAFLGDMLSGYSDDLAAEGYLGSRRRRSSLHRHAPSSVLVQQGRVVVDSDWNEGAARATCGVHRAAVLDDADPLGRRRLLVRLAAGGGEQRVWAEACLPVHDSGAVPATGQEVWVALESGDPSRPVWLGRRVTE